jgi:hypothetical protein
VDVAVLMSVTVTMTMRVVMTVGMSVVMAVVFIRLHGDPYSNSRPGYTIT